jgi:hypothetical protein
MTIRRQSGGGPLQFSAVIRDQVVIVRPPLELTGGGQQHLSPQVGPVGDRVAVVVKDDYDLLPPDGPVGVIDPAHS